MKSALIAFGHRTLALLAGAAIIVAIIWFSLGAAGRARIEAAVSRGNEAIASAQAGAAQETIRTIERHTENVTRIDTVTRENSAAIQAATGADAPIDPALHRAGLRALCLRDNQRDPSCAAVLQRDDGQPVAAGPDAPRCPADQPDCR